MSTTVTPRRLREALHYEPATGEFMWLVRPSKNIKAGSRAGSTDGRGYREIKIDRRRYKAHRLAWLWMMGTWPPHQIDHENLVKSDNHWSNLRLATNAQNGANVRPPRTNTSGAKGVSWCSRDKKWRPRIMHHGKQHHLGLFDTLEAAAEAYRLASIKYHGEFARAP